MKIEGILVYRLNQNNLIQSFQGGKPAFRGVKCPQKVLKKTLQYVMAKAGPELVLAKTTCMTDRQTDDRQTDR